MKRSKVLLKGLLLFGILTFLFASCSDDGSNEIEEPTEDALAIKQAAEIDVASETISDIIINAYEAEESEVLDRLSSSVNFLPGCVTVSIIAQQGFREITLDFGTEGCLVNGHVLRGQMVFSYTRNVEEQDVLITYNLIDFYFDDKQILGNRTILRQLSNESGYPQFTHTIDLTVIWPNGLQASREGVKVREWIEGFGSGVFSDNVFEVTGNWMTSFVNGNEHTYTIVTPLRRELICSYFVSGSVDVQRTNFGGILDYGDGDCDNQATFTFNNGNEIIITLN